MSTINIWSDNPIDWKAFDKAREKQCGPRRRAIECCKNIKDASVPNKVAVNKESTQSKKIPPTPAEKWLAKQETTAIIQQMKGTQNEHLLEHKRKRTPKQSCSKTILS